MSDLNILLEKPKIKPLKLYRKEQISIGRKSTQYVKKLFNKVTVAKQSD